MKNGKKHTWYHEGKGIPENKTDEGTKRWRKHSKIRNKSGIRGFYPYTTHTQKKIVVKGWVGLRTIARKKKEKNERISMDLSARIRKSFEASCPTRLAWLGSIQRVVLLIWSNGITHPINTENKEKRKRQTPSLVKRSTVERERKKKLVGKTMVVIDDEWIMEE